MDLKDPFEEYSARQEFEHELINRRITWLLTSQTILFAAYGLGLSKEINAPGNFLFVVAWCGLLSSFLLAFGIAAAAWAKWQSWKDYKELFRLYNKEVLKSSGQKMPLLVIAKWNALRQEWGVRTCITVIALFPDIFLPILFLIAWAVVICSG